MKQRRTVCLLLLTAAILAGCQTFPSYKVHHTLLDTADSRPPKRVLLMPLDITVSELSAGGLMDEVPEWSRQARQNLLTQLNSNLLPRLQIEPLPLPAVTEEQQQTIEQHRALYDTVSRSVLMLTMMPTQAWEHKIRRFDYTLGDGLAFLADQTGADAALFIVGEDLISSDSRKAAFIAAAAFGVGLQMGHTLLIGGMVDLRTGNILWLNHAIDVGSATLTSLEDTTKLLNALFKDYPGLEAYRKLKTAAK